jgi:signal transduction histidine kinase
MFKIFKKLDIYIILLFILITGQMIWWLIFFFNFQNRYIQLLKEYDKILLISINHEKIENISTNVYYDEKEKKFKIKESVIKEREEFINRNRNMLISEGSFYIFAFAILSFLILRFYYKQQQLLNEKTIFLNSFTHELKTPITAIKLNLQTLQKKVPKSKFIKELLDSSLYQIEILDQKINKILHDKEIRIQAIKKISLIKINFVINEVLNDLEKEILKKKAKITIENLYKDTIYLNIPPQWLSLILKEIIINSLKYSDEGVKVNIKIEKFKRFFKNYLKISIIDTGWGIPENFNTKDMLKPYFRFYHNKGYSDGTGLGLYYVNQIIKKCKGRMYINKINTGLKVEILLKLYNYKYYEK